MKKITILLIAFLCINAIQAQDKKAKDKDKKEEKKTYEDIITKDALSSVGLWSTHKVEDKHYFEIPDVLLEQEILVVSRISGFVKGLNFGGAGVRSKPQQVIRYSSEQCHIIVSQASKILFMNQFETTTLNLSL